MTLLAGQPCKDELLFSIANKTDGLEIILFARNDKQLESNEKAYVDLFLQGQFLSPECGEQSFRCANLVKLSVGSSRHIVFVPLLNGLLVLEIRYDGTEMKIEGYFCIEIEICSPTAVIEIFDSVYTICVNQSTESLKLYEIRLNTTTISNTYLSTALADVSLTDPRNLSNFVHASLDRDSHSQRIYFTTSSNLYELIPISIDYSRIGKVDPCSSVESLVYREWTLLAYCRDNWVIYFDLEEEKVIDTENSESDGQPYLCPNPHIHLRVFSTGSYIQFGFQESNTERFYELPGSAYHSGLCFGTENSSFLAYRDSQDGVYVFNLQTSELLQLSSMPCPVSGCKPLLVTDSNYLVVQEEDGITVSDREKNFSQIVAARHIKADLLTVIVREYQCPSGYEPNPGYSQNENSAMTKTVAGAVSASIVVISIVAIAVTVAVSVWVVHRRRRNKLAHNYACHIKSSVHNSYSFHMTDALAGLLKTRMKILTLHL